MPRIRIRSIQLLAQKTDVPRELVRKPEPSGLRVRSVTVAAEPSAVEKIEPASPPKVDRRRGPRPEPSRERAPEAIRKSDSIHSALASPAVRDMLAQAGVIDETEARVFTALSFWASRGGDPLRGVRLGTGDGVSAGLDDRTFTMTLDRLVQRGAVTRQSGPLGGTFYRPTLASRRLADIAEAVLPSDIAQGAPRSRSWGI